MEYLALILVVGFVVYFLPSMIGNNKKNFTGIFLLNLFLGWTFIFWVFALIWAVTSEKNEDIHFSPSSNINNPIVKNNDTKKCPFCAELIKKEAIVCRYCNRDIVSTNEEKTGINDMFQKSDGFKVMEQYKITFDGENYCYRNYKYAKLEDAVSYAVLQTKDSD